MKCPFAIVNLRKGKFTKYAEEHSLIETIRNYNKLGINYIVLDYCEDDLSYRVR